MGIFLKGLSVLGCLSVPTRLFLVLSTSLLLFYGLAPSHEGEVHTENSNTPVQEEKFYREIVYPQEVKLHPPMVHFAVATPLIALLISGYYFLRRRKTDSVEFFLIFISSSSVVAAAITGYIAHESMEKLPIKREALELLHTHEEVGIYLSLLFSFILLTRFIYILKPVRVIHLIYLTMLAVGVAGVFYQGSMGGTLVYDFGIGTNR
jgi:uncharacterized membrane protein